MMITFVAGFGGRHELVLDVVVESGGCAFRAINTTVVAAGSQL